MRIKIFSVAVFLFGTQMAYAAPVAGYYRIWQGFQRKDISQTEFFRGLPVLMNDTLSLYQDSLNNYLVATPPAVKPAFVPDEFALIGLDSEESYRRIRATPDGKTYGESHGLIFDMATSKSGPYMTGLPSDGILEHGKSYDLSVPQMDWRRGHSVFSIGLRKSTVSSEDFFKRLHRHISLTQQIFQPRGLRGYVVIVHENYEAVYMNWESREFMLKAFASSAGQQLIKEAATFTTHLQWSEMESYNGHSTAPGHLYNTSIKTPR